MARLPDHTGRQGRCGRLRCGRLGSYHLAPSAESKRQGLDTPTDTRCMHHNSDASGRSFRHTLKCCPDRGMCAIPARADNQTLFHPCVTQVCASTQANNLQKPSKQSVGGELDLHLGRCWIRGLQGSKHPSLTAAPRPAIFFRPVMLFLCSC
jgi:hypothetical protein